MKPTDSTDRPVQIEVTQEMIDAGVSAAIKGGWLSVDGSDPQEPTVRFLVEAVLLAALMPDERPSDNCERPEPVEGKRFAYHLDPVA